MCAGGPNRPYSVGPQDQSRGRYAYQLWAGDRIFGSGFDHSNPPPPLGGYGKSPPELIQVDAATTSR